MLIALFLSLHALFLLLLPKTMPLSEHIFIKTKNALMLVESVKENTPLLDNSAWLTLLL